MRSHPVSGGGLCLSCVDGACLDACCLSVRVWDDGAFVDSLESQLWAKGATSLHLRRVGLAPGQPTTAVLAADARVLGES